MYYNLRLKELREYKDISQAEMAKILNISQQHYSLYETGKTVMNVEKLIALCKALNVSADYVLGLSDTLKELKK